jgi:hypothetical protein
MPCMENTQPNPALSYCSCRPGFFDNASDASTDSGSVSVCYPCPLGRFLVENASTLDDQCQDCPANSKRTTPESLYCDCMDGFSQRKELIQDLNMPARPPICISNSAQSDLLLYILIPTFFFLACVLCVLVVQYRRQQRSKAASAQGG